MLSYVQPLLIAIIFLTFLYMPLPVFATGHLDTCQRDALNWVRNVSQNHISSFTVGNTTNVTLINLSESTMQNWTYSVCDHINKSLETTQRIEKSLNQELANLNLKLGFLNLSQNATNTTYEQTVKGLENLQSLFIQEKNDPKYLNRKEFLNLTDNFNRQMVALEAWKQAQWPPWINGLFFLGALGIIIFAAMQYYPPKLFLQRREVKPQEKDYKRFTIEELDHEEKDFKVELKPDNELGDKGEKVDMAADAESDGKKPSKRKSKNEQSFDV